MLETARLRLRPWSDDDLAPFAAMSADPEVMEHMPARLSRAQSDDLAAKIRGHMRERGFGLWAVELLRPAPAPFVGFVGLSVPHFDAPFTPCVEIGWRLARAHWGRGYATEGARAALAYGFGALALAEIVSFTTPRNLRSIAVMERLGMVRDPAEDFDHPRLPAAHPLARHVLYRLSRARWAATQAE
ncbi:MAG: GNAT family N-acetyltransferase [Myxococcales bacterium]|nr:GNAT family N-acetyltransferase [Myxococcales bacterium]